MLTLVQQLRITNGYLGMIKCKKTTSRVMICRCILTYELEFSRHSSQGPFVRINNRDIVFTSFLYDVSLQQQKGMMHLRFIIF